jgi:hypothetical protein
MNSFKTLGLFCTLLCFGWPSVSAFGGGSSDAVGTGDWVFSEMANMYAMVLKDTNVVASREMYLASFHRFVFEYWLESRTNQDYAFLYHRDFYRDMLHRRGKSDYYWNDPCALLQFYTNGQLSYRIGMPNIFGLDEQNLTESAYRGLVHRFQLAFADFSEVFPVEPVYTGPIVKKEASLSQGDNPDNLTRSLFGKKWQSVSRADDLGFGREEDPALAFKALTPGAQAYFMPAFLRMCGLEQSRERIKNLPDVIVSELSSDSISAQELRDKLNPAQKECIVADIENWHKDVPIRKLKEKFGF